MSHTKDLTVFRWCVRVFDVMPAINTMMNYSQATATNLVLNYNVADLATMRAF